jgi:Fe-S-cluster-containing hydrogenase component 2
VPIGGRKNGPCYNPFKSLLEVIMFKKLTVIPEQCSGCGICELVCAIEHFGVNNPKKAAIRVLNTYPHPVVRMPIVWSQCRVPSCAKVCPTDALQWVDGIVQLDEEDCICCYKCVEACPFGAIYAHGDCDLPIKCDMCGGDPKCVEKCPTGALRLIPAGALGETKRLNNVLSYTQMKEIEFYEKGGKKTIQYADIGKEEL